MNNSENAGKTEKELHNLDHEKYLQMKGGQSADHPWKYTGVCYVDHIFGQ